MDGRPRGEARRGGGRGLGGVPDVGGAGEGGVMSGQNIAFSAVVIGRKSVRGRSPIGSKPKWR